LLDFLPALKREAFSSHFRKSIRPRESTIQPPVINNPTPARTSASITYTPNPYHERESTLPHSGRSRYYLAAWHRISHPS
jgi:hypothetical protein